MTWEILPDKIATTSKLEESKNFILGTRVNSDFIFKFKSMWDFIYWLNSNFESTGRIIFPTVLDNTLEINSQSEINVESNSSLELLNDSSEEIAGKSEEEKNFILAKVKSSVD